MVLSAAAVIAGFIILLWGADRFVVGAAATARNFGVSPLIIGLTIVGFGTSAPEVIVSGVAAWQGNPGLAVGNALGSNITNIALVLGFTALIRPLEVHSSLVRREFPLLLGIMLLALLLVADGNLGRIDGSVLLIAFTGLLYWMVRQGLRTRECDPGRPEGDECDPLAGEYAAELANGMTTGAALGWLGAGLALLLVSSRMLVWGAVNIAEGLGVSDLVIGLTIVALGTSLPELAAAVMSALRNEHDIAVGNVIGSNMYNLLAVMGLPGLIRPGDCDRAVLLRDFPVMGALTIALFVLVVAPRGPRRITRFTGMMLCAAFIGYNVVLFMTSVGP